MVQRTLIPAIDLTLGETQKGQENVQSYIHLNHYSFQKHLADFAEEIIPEKFSFLIETKEVMQKPSEIKSLSLPAQELVAEQTSPFFLCRALSWTFTWAHTSSACCQLSKKTHVLSRVNFQ